MSENYFTELSSKDVSKYVEKKGKFSYLSWTYAVSEMCKIDPSANWEVIRFNGMPYLASECGYFVEVAVTIKGFTKSQIHPVLDNNNRPISQPNAFQINTSIQRCLVKAIALHGLGLYIYAGEDLPEQDYKALLEAVTSREELTEAWKSIPESHRKSLATLAKEIGLKYPRDEENPIKPEAKQSKSIANSSVDHATQAYEDNEARVYS